MARVVRIDTDEEIGYFVDLHGPLEDREGYSFGAWLLVDGTYRAEPAIGAEPRKINILVDYPDRADFALLVTPTYLDFIMSHPAFRPLTPRRRQSGRHRP
ncbi:MAG: hypothetical protein JO001_28520 [Alphaproteobacteria bacterium]|nr:hypothetical protein [Alphaproteobacteria bacterium]